MTSIQGAKCSENHTKYMESFNPVTNPIPFSLVQMKNLSL